MTVSSLDALSSFKQLRSIGFSESQAEAIAHKIQKTEMEEHLVTKDFLRDQLNHLEMRMTIKTASMFLALGSLMLAITYFR